MRTLAAALAVGLVGLAMPAQAQERSCMLGLVRAQPLVLPAAVDRQAVPFGHVGIAFLGHASFLIQSHLGVTVVTDYNGYNVPSFVPDIVTMNNAHGTHFTDVLDPGIKHVMRGWGLEGVDDHEVFERDLRVFNIPTNIRDWGRGERNENSIFVFESASLCLAHVGHLHHVLTQGQRRGMRRIDVMFLPIDGAWTMSHDEAFQIIEQVEPRVVIPMHFSWGGATGAFVARADASNYPVKDLGKAAVVVTRQDLPEGTEVWFLNPMQGGGFGFGED